MQAQHHYGRVNAYHGTKQQLLGAKVGQAAPAWRGNQATINGKRAAGPVNGLEKGSKILLSKLPMDVSENEVQQLFEKTVGPVRECFVVYNSQGKSKGMAVVQFHRTTDAVVARQKYNGKFVDGKRPITIEIVTEDEPRPRAPMAPAKPQVPSLLQRLGAQLAPPVVAAAMKPPAKAKAAKKAAAPAATKPAARPVASNSKAKLRTKKGPKRVKKAAATVDELDKEMDEYRAAVVA